MIEGPEERVPSSAAAKGYELGFAHGRMKGALKWRQQLWEKREKLKPETRVQLEAECERIEDVLCKELKWRPELQEELEKLKALEKLEKFIAPELLDSPKRWSDLPVAIVHTATSIVYLKALLLPLLGELRFRNVGRRQSEEDRRRLASSLDKAIAALNSVHAPLLDALVKSKYEDLRSIFQKTLEDVLRPSGKRRLRPPRSLTWMGGHAG